MSLVVPSLKPNNVNLFLSAAIHAHAKACIPLCNYSVTTCLQVSHYAMTGNHSNAGSQQTKVTLYINVLRLQQSKHAMHHMVGGKS